MDILSPLPVLQKERDMEGFDKYSYYLHLSKDGN